MPPTTPATEVQLPGPAEMPDLPAAGDAVHPGQGPKPLEGGLTPHFGNISHIARQMRQSRGALYRRLQHWRQIAPE